MGCSEWGCAGACLGGCQGREDMLGEIPTALSCLTICRRCKVITIMCTAGLPQHAQQDRHSTHSGQRQHAQQGSQSMHSRVATACTAGSQSIHSRAATACTADQTTMTLQTVPTASLIPLLLILIAPQLLQVMEDWYQIY